LAVENEHDYMPRAIAGVGRIVILKAVCKPAGIAFIDENGGGPGSASVSGAKQSK
jgi:hypothetical protein